MIQYLDKERELDEARKEKFIQEIEKEEEFVNNTKKRKASKEVINRSVERLYNEAERRKLAREAKLEELRKSRESREDYVDTPTKYRSRVNIPNYNFTV